MGELSKIAALFAVVAHSIFSRQEKHRLVQFQLEEEMHETAVSENTRDEYERLPLAQEKPPSRWVKLAFTLPGQIRASAPPWLLDEEMREDTKLSGIVLPAHLKTEEENKSREQTFRQKLAKVAESFLINKINEVQIQGINYRIDRDCAQFVRAVYWVASGGKTDLFYEAFATGSLKEGSGSGVVVVEALLRNKLRYTPRQAKLGDIIVFDNTYDKNRNQKRDDPLTHLGVVTGFTEEGTIVFVHGNASRTIKRGYINFQYPEWTVKNGRHYNSYGRLKYSWDQDEKGRLNAALVRGFGGY
ncbi:MAG: hypothetical protein NZM25_00205 [Leptospiraceae bacterium]|nr:hypothetical protein [Leptospiraceae bacterium]MDW8307537.1 hypothetical protein [Leptospiraceae bacterium]